MKKKLEENMILIIALLWTCAYSHSNASPDTIFPTEYQITRFNLHQPYEYEKLLCRNKIIYRVCINGCNNYEYKIKALRSMIRDISSEINSVYADKRHNDSLIKRKQVWQ